MNVLFLIGNGFDLNVGLKTRFKDVLESYLTKEEKPMLRTKKQTLGEMLMDNNSIIKKFKEDIKLNIENWSDFEKHLGIYTEKYNAHEIDDFCLCIKHFKEHLIEHLKKEEEQIDYNLHKDAIVKIFNRSISNFYEGEGLNDSAKNLLQSIIYKSNKQGNRLSYNFITFNYTKVLDKCLSYIEGKNIDNVLHIHGDVNKSPILGVDNYSQIKNTELAKHKKIGWTIIKPTINNSLKNTINADATALIAKSDIICLFGLSLGETDKTWWKCIGDYLQTSSKQLVIFNLVDAWNSIHPEEEIERIDQIEEKFCTSADISVAARFQIARKIHIGLNTDLFKLDLTSVG